MSEFEIKPPLKSPPMVRAGFCCDEKLWNEFKKKCENNSLSKSEVLRQLMEYYLRSSKP